MEVVGGWLGGYIYIYIYTHNPFIINRGSPRCSRVVSKYGHERGTTTRESSLLACVLHDMCIYPTSICKILGWHKHNHHNLPVQPKNNHFLVHFFFVCDFIRTPATTPSPPPSLRISSQRDFRCCCLDKPHKKNKFLPTPQKK